MNHIFCGKHVLAEFYGIELPRFNQKELEACVQAGCEKAGAHIVDIRTACFSNGGYTLVALLKESHISIHVYAEHRAAFLDAFTCGNTNPGLIIEALAEYYRPQQKKIQEIQRGAVNSTEEGVWENGKPAL